MDDAGSSLRGDFEELYERWFAAIPRHDDSFFQDVLADDWVYTDTSGTVRGKAEYVPYIARPVRRAAERALRARAPGLRRRRARARRVRRRERPRRLAGARLAHAVHGRLDPPRRRLGRARPPRHDRGHAGLTGCRSV